VENPYRPPQSSVADTDDAPRRPRPPGVTRAVTAFWIAWVLGLVSLLPGVREGIWADADVPLAFSMTLGALLAGFSAWLIVMTSRGRNWARWTLVIYTAVTWLLLLTDPDALSAQGTLAVAFDFATLAVEIYACCLVLFGQGVEWFRKPAAGG
jgi:hypothetical protein